MKFKYILHAAVVILGLYSFASCRDFVEVDGFSQRTLRFTSDYEYLINNKSNFEMTVVSPMITSDDVAPDAADTPNLWGANPEYLNMFVWADRFYNDGQKDMNWKNLYFHIYVANQVLDGVMESERGTTAQKNRVAAEAKVHRAFAYLTLANLYAPVYDPSKAVEQTGVPLLTEVDLYRDLSRASLQAVYDRILDDLLTAVDGLTNYPVLNHHPSKLAAYTLLSRTYLVMRNFEEAARYADLALDLNPDLLDLQTYSTSNTSYPLVKDDPEVILSKRVSTFNLTVPLNEELIELYAPDDLRLVLFLKREINYGNAYMYKKPNFSGGAIVVGVRTPEIILNRAELYAREGNVDKTVEMLNLLRVKRFEADKFMALTAADIESDPLQAVLDERRREFVGTDMRWFDQRRLNLDPAYAKTVTRSYQGKTYTLDPNSSKFVYPIEESLLQYNPEIGQKDK